MSFEHPRKYDGVSYKDHGDLLQRISVLETKVNIGGAILLLFIAAGGYILKDVWDKFSG